MDITHAQTLAQARAHLAALANLAATLEASSAYERTLIELDRIHGDQSPGIDHQPLTHDGALLYGIAVAAIEELHDFGVDPLSIELVLIMLADARRQELA